MFVFFLPNLFRYGTQVLVYLSHDRTSRIDKPNPLVRFIRILILVPKV